MMRPILVVACLWALVLNSCDETGIIVVDNPVQRDVFTQEPEPKLDVLWVIDNSASMLAEQEKVASEAAHFFQRLIGETADYQVGVITTDPVEGGALRAYNGPPVAGCDGCRYITRATPCADPEQPETCSALSVFQNLARVGTDGTALERPFEQVRLALGLTVLDSKSATPILDSATGQPFLSPPRENGNFLRDDADLMIIFVSDENEGLKRLGSPVRYYERLFSSAKAGKKGRILVAAITGWPPGRQEDPKVPEAAAACDFLSPLFTPGADRESIESLLDSATGCRDVNAPSSEHAYAELGVRYAELSCRFGGVVVNICDRDYRAALRKLSDAALRLANQFPLRFAGQIDRGKDCLLFTADDPQLDCDGDGTTEGPLDGTICVRADDGSGARVVAREAADGWSWDETNRAIVFSGGFTPAPDSEIGVEYTLVRRGDCRS